MRTLRHEQFHTNRLLTSPNIEQLSKKKTKSGEMGLKRHVLG